MDIADQKWLEWNHAGFIPGPKESREEFETRVNYCNNIESELSTHTGEFPFLEQNQYATKEILGEACEKSETLYGIYPSWIPLFFSNYQLALWHGGCAWIFQIEENSPLAAFIQLRAKFKTQTTYLGLYRRNELISHELAHIGRMAFEEPQFEEIFAYQSSSSSWRRWIGPLVQSWKESLLFMALLAVLVFLHILFISYPIPILHQTIIFFEWITIGLLGYAVFRRIKLQKQYKKCFKQLELLLDLEKAKHVMYRLTDKEIKEFSYSSMDKIKSYITNNDSFRWIFIRHIYFSDVNDKKSN